LPEISDENIPEVVPVCYWLLIGGVAEGPFDFARVRAKLASGEVGRQTRACPVGGNAWVPLARVPGLGLERTRPPRGLQARPAARVEEVLEVLPADDEEPLLHCYRDYNEVPWYRRSGVAGVFVLTGLLCFAPLIWTVCFLCLTGDIYNQDTDKEGYLTRWSWWNKIAAVIILIIQAVALAWWFLQAFAAL
jgi:hypothetical protein